MTGGSDVEPKSRDRGRRHGDRVAALRPEDLAPDQRELYDRLLSSRRATEPRPFPIVDDEGRLRGPFNAMLLNPVLGHALQELGAVVRYGTGLTPREREIAILVVAAHERSDYEWTVHLHAARKLGFGQEEIAALRTGADCAFDDPVENAVLTSARELATTGDLTDDRFAGTVECLGLTRLYELVTLVGYYRLLASQLRVLRITD